MFLGCRRRGPFLFVSHLERIRVLQLLLCAELVENCIELKICRPSDDSVYGRPLRANPTLTQTMTLLLPCGIFTAILLFSDAFCLRVMSPYGTLKTYRQNSSGSRMAGTRCGTVILTHGWSAIGGGNVT